MRTMAMSGVLVAAPGASFAQAGSEPVQALQTNYGLRLEATRNPADILVIDRAEKVPTEK
jgi:uncharacterized protein (TIGR03435 family)